MILESGTPAVRTVLSVQNFAFSVLFCRFIQQKFVELHCLTDILYYLCEWIGLKFAIRRGGKAYEENQMEELDIAAVCIMCGIPYGVG